MQYTKISAWVGKKVLATYYATYSHFVGYIMTTDK